MSRTTLFLTLLVALLLTTSVFREDWGFFAHRRINRMATFTLPPDMMALYRPNIDYLTEHAVDPDKRRYATRHEAVRHYIDIDHWGTYPYPNVPRNWAEALLKFAEVQLINGTDTSRIWVDTLLRPNKGQATALLRVDPGSRNFGLPLQRYRSFWYQNLLPQYYEEEWILSCDSIAALLGDLPAPCAQVRVIDHFSEYGIVPYHLIDMQNRLTRAFRQKNMERIVQLSAEMGHYVSDAHVPLHTTENYNGQLTGQTGIHGFWESRLPELFADEEYDYFVGKAEYINNPSEYYWDIVLTSNSLVDSVLGVERRLRETFPEDQQYCFVDRLDATIRTQCPEFALAYSKAMEGMVEDRMRASILAVGSAWYTAWVDAGQPDLRTPAQKVSDDNEEQQNLDANYRQGEIKGRPHDGGT